MQVWSICGVGALVAAVLLFFVPRLAFADAAVGDTESRKTDPTADQAR
jgi:hypothetical protein